MRRASCVFRRGCGPEGSLELEKSAVCHDCIDGHIVRLRWQRVDDFFVKHHRNNRDAVVADLLKRPVVIAGALAQTLPASVHSERRDHQRSATFEHLAGEPGTDWLRDAKRARLLFFGARGPLQHTARKRNRQPHRSCVLDELQRVVSGSGFRAQRVVGADFTAHGAEVIESLERVLEDAGVALTLFVWFAGEVASKSSVCFADSLLGVQVGEPPHESETVVGPYRGKVDLYAEV